MDNYSINYIGELIKDNSYPGRGLVVGKSEDGKYAVAAYFIMGRSNNSRNRIFALKDGDLYTEPYDSSKVEDPSLIIYPAMKSYENYLIVTNGDQTDTILKGLKKGLTFSKSLESRKFEPDFPNLTPRISGIVNFKDNDFDYEISILKSVDSVGTECSRYTYSYKPVNGLGHFIHTYKCDGNPIPSFVGEPERVIISSDIDTFTNNLWDNLDKDNKISLYVRYINIKTKEIEDRLINKNK